LYWFGFWVLLRTCSTVTKKVVGVFVRFSCATSTILAGTVRRDAVFLQLSFANE
jgi:hypothetical protein